MKLSACVSVVALVAAGALPAVAQQVGTVAAVNRDMTGTPPGATPRELNLGLDVVRDERVETSGIGSGQLMFLDQTTLTVAPNSDITLDTYVYDPNAGTSDLALSVTKGALRFIGGRITKDGPAIVRTPTATVGIRGGMAVLQVDEQGVTQVIHIAGEFTSVTQFGDANGDGLDDGSAPDGARSRVVLSRPNAMAEASAAGVEFTGLADADQLAGIYGKLEGQGQGGVERAPSDSTVQDGSQQVAGVNSGVAGGDTNQPVSTSGEQAAPAAGPAEQGAAATTLVQNTDPEAGGDTGGAEAPPAGTLVPEGGAIFSPTLGFQPFDSTAAGSLIGRSDGETVTLPVPATPDTLLSVHPEGAGFTPRAIALYPDTGLFPFDPETATSTTLGGLSGEFGTPGVGLADFTNEFVFVPFVASDLGIVMFGTPTPGQGQFFPGDPNTAGANTVDAYHNEFGLDLGRSFLFLGGGGRNPVPEQLFLVGKSGDPRFTAPVVFGEGATVFAEPVGRAVAAGLDLSGGTERLALFVEPLLSSGALPAEKMVITGDGFVTLNQNGTYSFGEPAYGTFEDADGHTLFGPEGNYFVLSSVSRERDGTLDTTDFGTDQLTLSATAPGGTTVPFTPPFRASLFTRDATLAEVIADPLPLAGQTSGTGQSGALDGGFAAAAVICSSGNCGDDQDPSEGFSFNGAYALLSRDPTDVQVKFDDDTAGAGFNFALHTVEEGGDPNIAFAGADPGLFVFRVPDNGIDQTGDSYGAYLDDRRFAAVGTGQQVIAGNSQLGTVGLASSGLVGTPGGLFPAETATAPDYLRWGYWAATYQVEDGTSEQIRTDLVPIGTFVAGTTPDPADLREFTGSARFAGLAVGTAADLANGTTRTIGGSFSLDYDFGNSQGNLDLDLPTFLEAPVSVSVTGVNGNVAYAGEIDSIPLGAEVHGGFFAGGGDPIAATAGNFGIVDEVNNTAAVGVFGGDRTGFTPAIPDAVAAVAN